jgi:hypothetical protein
MVNSRCYKCDDPNTQTRTIALTALVALLLLALLATAVATLQAMQLAFVIQLFLILQTLALQAVDGVRDSPYYREPLSTAASYINWINFDVAILKPGCGGLPSFTYIRKVQLNFALLALALLLFFIAVCVRTIMRMRSEGRLASTLFQRSFAPKPQLPLPEDAQLSSRALAFSPSSTAHPNVTRPHTAADAMGSAFAFEAWVHFKERLEHTMIVLLSIFYLRVTLLSLLAFSCTRGPDPVTSRDSAEVLSYSLYLTEDMQVRSSMRNKELIAAHILASERSAETRNSLICICLVSLTPDQMLCW